MVRCIEDGGHLWFIFVVQWFGFLLCSRACTTPNSKRSRSHASEIEMASKEKSMPASLRAPSPSIRSRLHSSRQMDCITELCLVLFDFGFGNDRLLGFVGRGHARKYNGPETLERPPRGTSQGH